MDGIVAFLDNYDGSFFMRKMHYTFVLPWTHESCQAAFITLTWRFSNTISFTYLILSSIYKFQGCSKRGRFTTTSLRFLNVLYHSWSCGFYKTESNIRIRDIIFEFVRYLYQLNKSWHTTEVYRLHQLP